MRALYLQKRRHVVGLAHLRQVAVHHWRCASPRTYGRKKNKGNVYGALQGAVSCIYNAQYNIFIAYGALQGAVHVEILFLPTVV